MEYIFTRLKLEGKVHYSEYDQLDDVINYIEYNPLIPN